MRKRKKAEPLLPQLFRELAEAIGKPASEPRRRARRARPTLERPPARSLHVCDACGESYPRLCEDCNCCSSCCGCDDDELFDADELGLDPEDDDARKYGEEDDA